MHRQFRALVTHFFGRFFDVESTSPDADNRVRVIQYLALLTVPGLMISFFMLGDHPATSMWVRGTSSAAERLWLRVGDRYVFVAYAMVAMGLLMTFKWDSLFPDRRDYQILTSLPISPRRWFAAKMLALFAFLSLFVVAINVFSLLLVPRLVAEQSRIVSSTVFWESFLAHAAGTIGGSIFAALMFGALQGILINVMTPDAFKRISPSIQMVSIAVLVTVLLVIPLAKESIPKLAQNDSPVLDYFPPMWFLGLYEALIPGGSLMPRSIVWARTAFYATAVTGALFVVLYLVGYRRYSRKVLESAQSGMVLLRTWKRAADYLLDRTLLQNPVQRGTFHFIEQISTRSPKHRILTALYMGIGIALAISSLFVIDRQSLSAFPFRLSVQGALEAPLILAFVLVSGLRATFNVPFELNANWMFQTTGDSHGLHFMAAVRKWLFLYRIVPLFAFVGVFEFQIFDATTALYHLVFDLIVAAVLIEVLFFRFNKVPFTCAYSSKKIALAWIAAGYLFVFPYVGIAGGIKWSVSQSPLRMAVFVGIGALVLAAFQRSRGKTAIIYRDDDPEVLSLGEDRGYWSVGAVYDRPALRNETSSAVIDRPYRGRAIRGLPEFTTYWLDVKLGARMLARYWGLTVVGGLAMTVAFAIAGMFFVGLNMFVNPTLPFEEGDRIVALQIWHTGAQRSQEANNDDFERWRKQLRSVEDVGAFRHVLRSLSVNNAAVETVAVAEMSGSGFDLARIPPLRGRVFAEDDALSGADRVVVIGYEAWRTRFAFDPALIGKSVRLDGTPHTVIGIMPNEFAFPVNHSYWIPLRRPSFGSTEDPEAGLRVFARLAAGAAIESAQAELDTLGLSSSVAGLDPDTRLRPRVLPYTHAFNEPGGRIVRLIQFLVSLILVPPCVNFAILFYARTIARQEEFSARYALGASRGRIVSQLFMETLVLTAIAAVIAFGLVSLLFEYGRRIISADRPFWMWRDNSSFSFETALYLAGLAVAAAIIAGVLPALWSTRRLLRPGLLAPHAMGSRSGLRLGGTWTTLVILQVAISMAALPSAIDGVWYVRSQAQVPAFAHEVLTARVRLERQPEGVGVEASDFTASFGGVETELIRRLREAPGVRAATIGLVGPGGGGSRAVIEIERGGETQNRVDETAGATAERGPLRVSLNRVDEDFFDVFNMRLLSGRGFEARDFTLNSDAVIVSRFLAERISGREAQARQRASRDLLGRRLRFVNDGDGPVLPEPDRWYEIVGIVDDGGANLDTFHPALPGRVHPAYLALDVGADPATSVARIREIAESVAPTLHVDEFASLHSLMRRTHTAQFLLAAAAAAMTLSVLLLSAAGIHALMSVIVNQRRREIGIRLALGAPPYPLVRGIFRRAAFGLAAGAAGGVLFALLIRRLAPEVMAEFRLSGVIPAAAALVILIGLVAASGPVRRALRVDPNETLRDA